VACLWRAIAYVRSRSCFFALSQLNIVLQDPCNREEQVQEVEAAPRDTLRELRATSLSSAVYRMLAKCVTLIMPPPPCTVARLLLWLLACCGQTTKIAGCQRAEQKQLRVVSAPKKRNEAGGTHIHTHTHTHAHTHIHTHRTHTHTNTHTHTHTHTGVRDGDSKMRVAGSGTPRLSMKTPRVWGRKRWKQQKFPVKKLTRVQLLVESGKS
jgi:hypothetical protein